MDLENANNSLKLIGEPLERIVEQFTSSSSQLSHRHSNGPPTTAGATTSVGTNPPPYESGSPNLAKDIIHFETENTFNEFLYDEIEAIIFNYVKSNHFHSFRISNFFSDYINFLILSERSPHVDDFTLFRVLGRGGFGVVNGCKHSYTGKLYAMKVMERRRIKSMRAETLCLAERQTMVMLDSPFIVGLQYAFTTSTELYLILDLMVGGDLGYALFRRRSFPIDEVKYYTIRTLLGLKALHDLSIVFRDLKPENILMDEKGRTKLSDLGLAVRISRNGITGTCGSRGYWAPEMLRRDSEGKRIRYKLAVDWFSFGCVIFEFFAGICPFRTPEAKTWSGILQKDKAMDKAILEMEPKFTPDFDPIFRNLCERLLEKDENIRLGANGATEVMAHPYFDDVNWDAYLHDTIKPPFVPNKDLNAASQHEIGNFNDRKLENVQLTPMDLELFEDWDYIRSQSFYEEIVIFKRFEEIHVRPPPTPHLAPLSSSFMTLTSLSVSLSLSCRARSRR
jgi:beta-adrenergic-receptor kinase